MSSEGAPRTSGIWTAALLAADALMPRRLPPLMEVAMITGDSHYHGAPHGAGAGCCRVRSLAMTSAEFCIPVACRARPRLSSRRIKAWVGC